MQKILHNIYRFEQQFYYGMPVGVYLIELEAEIVLFELPAYTEQNRVDITAFGKPVKSFLSHGSTGILDGELWQRNLGVKVFLHKADKNYSWLKMRPDVFLDNKIKTEEYEIIHNPGHSAGSISLLHYESKSLFTGDTLAGLNNEIRDFTLSAHDDDQEQKMISIKELAKYDFENILPFHYEMVIGSAGSKLKKAIRQAQL